MCTLLSYCIILLCPWAEARPPFTEAEAYFNRLSILHNICVNNFCNESLNNLFSFVIYFPTVSVEQCSGISDGDRLKASNESLSKLHQDIRKLMALTYPKQTAEACEEIARDHFTNALSDPDFALKWAPTSLLLYIWRHGRCCFFHQREENVDCRSIVHFV